MYTCTFHERSMRGKFQGTMAATTPMGAHPCISVSISCAQPREPQVKIITTCELKRLCIYSKCASATYQRYNQEDTSAVKVISNISERCILSCDHCSAYRSDGRSVWPRGECHSLCSHELVCHCPCSPPPTVACVCESTYACGQMHLHMIFTFYHDDRSIFVWTFMNNDTSHFDRTTSTHHFTVTDRLSPTHQPHARLLEGWR